MSRSSMAVEIPESVKQALGRYWEIAQDRDSDPAVRLAQSRLSDLEKEVELAKKDLQKIKARFRAPLQELEEYIFSHTLELGGSFQWGGVQVIYRSGYERVTWSNKEMTALCMANPALLQLLQPARKVTEVAPLVKIEILEPEIRVELVEESPNVPF